MIEKVALVKCDSYDGKEIYRCLNKIFMLLEINLNDLCEKNKTVFLKPNLCLPETFEKNLTTHPEIIRQLVRIIKEFDKNTCIRIGDTSIGIEGRNDRVWKNTGMDDVVAECEVEKCELNERISLLSINAGNKNYDLPISNDLLESNVINLPKLKTHGYMLMTGCVKNMYGVLAGDSKRKLHKMAGTKQDFSKLLVSLYNKINCKINIVDAIIGLEGDGPGAKGVSRKIGVIVAGKNGFAVDQVLAKLINIHENQLLTNVMNPDKDFDIEIVGDDIEELIVSDFKLPSISQRNDKIIEHAIVSRSCSVSIDNSKCILCRKCINNCPMEAMSIDGNSISIDRKRCIKCLVCLEVCPNGAINARRNNLFSGIESKKRRG